MASTQLLSIENWEMVQSMDEEVQLGWKAGAAHYNPTTSKEGKEGSPLRIVVNGGI